ncbi:MAG TPA: serine/threonine-protein kinase [Thermoanaerobaculia bacterium]|nr:serine/threonine-protein kinase [Thermoanaerobaculia bacterium]
MSGAPWLSDAAVGRLREATEAPVLVGNRYEVGERLGRGGMGVVYRAHDRQLGRDVALKVLPLAADGDRGAAERLRREARILARLEHPGIVPVHDLGLLADGGVYYAMKRVDGRRLDEVVEGPAAEGELAGRLRLLLSVCEAVAFAHEQGVVHRDLKPENVMVGPFGEVLVMDWGVAKLLAEAGVSKPLPESADPSVRSEDETPGTSRKAVATGENEVPGTSSEAAGTSAGTVLGTPGYMAPEQARGEVERHDRRADVHALGALLHFLVTGAAPGAAGANGPLPVPLAAVVAKATAEDPEARYDGAGGIASEVSRYLAGLPVAAHREGPFERTARFVRRYRLPIGIVLAYLLVRLAFLFFAGF